MEFDSVQIGVADLDAAAHAYELLLGVRATTAVNGARRFQLGHGAVELEGGDPGLHSISFAGDDIPDLAADAFHGLRVLVARPVERGLPDADGDGVEAIDHVVINTPNMDRAIALWRDRLGLRLALDREFPARGLRMAFFRSAGVTLEFVSPLTEPPDRVGADSFYGIAYRVRSIAAARERLPRAGFDVSGVRPGQKRGTLVATVRSGTAGVPTLLIEDPSRAE